MVMTVKVGIPSPFLGLTFVVNRFSCTAWLIVDFTCNTGWSEVLIP